MAFRFEGTNPKMRIKKISGGITGVKQTLREMVDVVAKNIEDPYYRQLATSIVVGPNNGNGRFYCAVKDFECEARLLLKYVQNNVRWTRDTYNIETLQTPQRTLGFVAGDCDDMSILLATLALSIGIPAKFRAIAVNNRPDFSHVYVLLNIGVTKDKWVAADPTPVPHAQLGWQVRFSDAMDWDIDF